MARFLLALLVCAGCARSQSGFSIIPEIITKCGSSGLGRARLSWNQPGAGLVQVRVVSPSGPVMTGLGPPTGTAETGEWVSDGLTFFLVDEGGRELPAGSTGELWLRERIPHATFAEYFRRPAETEQFRVDGWMRTGDLMHRDEDGYYYYVDRKKDVIRVRGENASPTLIENALLDHPAVMEVVAVSVPSEVGDDEIKVAVKPKAGSRLDPLDLARWAESRLPYYLVPRYVEVVDEIPKTPNLKPQRYRIQSSGTHQAVDLRGLGYKPTRPY